MTAPATNPSAHFLVGPTAVGKSRVAEWIAEQAGWAILSADSMLVYRGMDVGTAKPTASARARVRYYGLDLVTPDQTFSVANWLAHARAAFAGPHGGRLIVTGGTGLYVRCLTEGLRDSAPVDVAARATWERVLADSGVAGLQAALRARAPDALDALADPQNPRRLIRALEQAGGGPQRPERQWRAGVGGVPCVGLRLPVEALKTNIERRVREMYDQGFVAEVERLRQEHATLSATASQAIGYAEVLSLLDGRCSIADAVRRTTERTRQYAKRQRTWFERQANVVWIAITPDEAVPSIGARVMAQWMQLGKTPLAGIVGM
ncbi:MAG: tRNA (adenosine(37)-N6)-dimethylallyltransferase MiaA [Verrucomicrobia bacterium]|nr:tRNA (adenosine(37)-N6)-dimethylallyltransferase MiaA [Verrucomicrobiota bacterium]